MKVPGARASRPQNYHKGWRSRGYLPHFDSAWEIQSIAFRLYDATPAQLIAGGRLMLHAFCNYHQFF
jgi:hypothetical protein